MAARHAMLTAMMAILAPASASLQVRKAALLDAIAASRQGREMSVRPRVQQLVEELEGLNPCPRPLESAPEKLTACWQLVYTTSDSILGSNRARLFRPRPLILQSINAAELSAKNEEWVLGGLLKNSVRAKLTPRDDGATVDVQFTRFGIGWVPIPAPPSARGVLETTFLDDEMRISRGDKGNTFVLLNSGDPPRC